MTEEITPSVPTAKRAPSIFRSLEGNDACESLHLLTVLPTLAPIRIDAPRCTVASRFQCQPSVAGFIVRVLHNRSLPSRYDSYGTRHGRQVRTEENFFRRTITINSFTGRRWSIRSDGGQCPVSARHFSSAEAKANGLLEGLYLLTLGRFGGHGLLHDGSPNAQRVDDLLCAVLHSLGESPSDTGRIHAVPGSGVDGAAGAKHDYGGVGKPEGLPLFAARPR